jgi:hypothetical protein
MADEMGGETKIGGTRPEEASMNPESQCRLCTLSTTGEGAAGFTLS